MLGKDILVIIVILVLGGIAYLVYNNSSTDNQLEYIASVNQEETKLAALPNVDCSLNCCGFNTKPLVLDGLKSKELADAIDKYTTVYNDNGTMARTNYSCGRATFAPGPYLPTGNNVGCPCVDQKAYSLIRTRGASENKEFDMDKSLLVVPHEIEGNYGKVDNRSVFSETRKLQ